MQNNYLLTCAEKGLIPDFFIRMGIRHLCKQRLLDISAMDCEMASELKAKFFAYMRLAEIAPLPEKANSQHYELPAEFFNIVLGKQRKYSSCYWPANDCNLDVAEEVALEQTAKHAELKDGQSILELGCGWGSLSLWMARHYPNSQITSVSNSKSQRAFIIQEAKKLGLDNLTVITADMNQFEIKNTFDRIVSVEMFEHMRNYEVLYKKINHWLKQDGKFMMHIFCHRDVPYAFEVKDNNDWMSEFFFSGGFMPSDDTPYQFQQDLRVTKQWRWSGTHYQKTANAWLKNMDDHSEVIKKIFDECYGKEAAQLWIQRWRIFFMACAELFGFDNGQTWWVSHYLLEKQSHSIAK
jgi:cyclopropane-fatty-acyl-phospholipid synthase